MAKQIIKLINVIAAVVNSDPIIGNKLKVFFFLLLFTNYYRIFIFF